MLIQTKAYARAGLIGNPSDGYYGKTISFILKNFSARVTCYESPRLTIRPQRCDRLEYADLSDLEDDIRQHGYYGGIRLIKAAVNRFAHYCRGIGRRLDRNVTLEYETDIPIRVGLAGSSAIVTATFRALMAFFGVAIPQPVLPGLILSAELDELKIGAGLQDRVVQVYGGVVFMDFDRERMRRDGHGLYEPLEAAALPPLYVAYHDNLAEGTEVTHNDLRSRFTRGEPAVLDGIKRWAELTQQARDLIVAGRGREIGALMDANFDLRASLIPISPGNGQLVAIGRSLGAGVNFAGSGGAVVGCYDGDPARLARLRTAYAEMGASLIVPEIV
jgi:glucuronokinase